MYLKHLIIANREEEIRNIVFHPGMNLIVDDTLADSEMTGNNVNILWKRPAFPEQYNNTDQKYLYGYRWQPESKGEGVS